jgi:arylsulfatase A-like enzyme
MLFRFLFPYLCLLMVASVGASAGAAAPPNVVLVVADDQHWSDYGFMGHEVVKTPHLDKLASQSLVFPRGYVPSSLCCPSLASIISGMYPHQSLITSNDPPVLDGKKRMGLNDPAFVAGREKFNQHMDQLATLPRILRTQGYLSFQTGKWWQGDYTRGGFTHGMTRGSRHGDEGLKIGREGLQPVVDFVDHALAEKKPFLVWYAPFMPHTPHTPPERLLNQYRDKTTSLHVAKYWAMVEWFDETCGELMKLLDERQVAENTLVIYVCDNGWIQDPDSPKYAGRSKQSQYDGGLRTPIMVRWLGRVDPGRSESVVSSIDIAPTVLNALGLPAVDGMQGLNLLDRNAVAGRKAVFGEIFTHDSQDLEKPEASLRWRWVIEGDHKLIVPDARNEAEAEVELYDLSRDQDEQNNLAKQEPERVKQLMAKLDQWWNPAPADHRSDR